MELRNGMWWDGDFALLSWDDATRTATWVRFDEDGGYTFRTDQHAAENAIEPNAEFAKATEGKKFGDWVRIASVPNIIAEQHQLDDRLKNGDFGKWLNDGDNRAFKTSRGRF